MYMGKYSKYIIGILIGAALMAIVSKLIGNKAETRPYTPNTKNQHQRSRNTTQDPAATAQATARHADNEADVNRHPQRIIFTKHAKCRMACRHLDDSEVREILEHGKINFAKSNDRAGSCPTYALEGRTHDGQQTRMVFAFCNATEAKVVTVIDLDTDWKCDCE
jgi:hypothetical protein